MNAAGNDDSTATHVLLHAADDEADDADDADYGGMPPARPPRMPVPRGVKVCALATFFVVAMVVGSTGHAAYTAAFAAVGEAEYVAAAALIAGLDHTADVCTDPWTFFCGRYEQAHYMSGSRIGDLSTVEWRRALKAYEAQKTGQSAAFFDACVARGADDAAGCSAIYPDPATLRGLWRAGVAHSNIGISRMPHPDTARAHERAVVMWALNDTSGVDVYPTNVDAAADPCGLVDLFEAVVCPDWATAAECAAPRFLVAGEVAALCTAWTAVRRDPNASAVARAVAVDACYNRAARLASPLGCFLRTAEYYPDANLPYLAVGRARSSGGSGKGVAEWFEAARTAVIEVAAPLGPAVRARLEAVELHAGWSAQNLPTPPPQLHVGSNGSDRKFVEAVAAHDAWQMETEMREATQVHPRWAMNSWSINAYYQPSTNEIYVPDSMAALVSPIEPATVGTLLFILSHELGHAFDPTSTVLDAGLLVSAGPEAARYAAAKQCILSDYVNANETVGEDFADFIGIQAVAKYVAGKMGTKNEIRVKERTYTPAQQTLAAFGGFWCASTDNDAAPGESRDPHSLPRDRVVQAVVKSTSAFGFGPCPTNPAPCRFFAGPS